MAYLSTAELEFVGPRDYIQRRGSALQPEARSQNELSPHFETVEVCQREDRRRAAALREFDEGVVSSSFGDNDDDWLFERSADELATLLDQIADPDRTIPAPPCLASSVYLRGRQIGVFGAALEPLAAHPELDRAWFSGSHPALSFRANGRGVRVIAEARSRLHDHLQLSGTSSAPGFLLAFLNGHLIPELEQFHLHYRGLVLGDKLTALRQPSRPTPASPSPARQGLAIAIHPIADMGQQLTRVMPWYLRERSTAVPANAATLVRMREPYHSMYLLWLAKRDLADLLVVDGAFYWYGGLELRQCYSDNKAVQIAIPR